MSVECHKLRHLCDGILQTDDGELLPVHRVILSVVSPFFCTAFRAKSFSSGPNICKVEGVSSPILRMIVAYAITKQITISDSNVQDLLIAADYLEIPSLLESCCNYVCNQISLENCTQFFQTSTGLEHLGLTPYCKRFIEIQLSLLVNPKDSPVLHLATPNLVAILSSDGLNVSGEDKVCDIVKRWIHANPSAAFQDVTSVLDCLRIDDDKLQSFFNDLGNDDFKKEFTNFWINKEIKPERPIAPRKTHIILHIKYNLITTYITYDENIDFARFWRRFPHFSSVVSEPDGTIYFMEGMLCWTISAVDNLFVRLPDLQFPRLDYGIAAIDGCIYVIGGVLTAGPGGDQTILQAVERYDPGSGQWSWAQAAPSPCRGPVTVLRKKIYALGVRSENGECSIPMQRYDPESNSWSEAASLTGVIEVRAVVTCREKIYTLCLKGRSAIMLEYDADSNFWSEMAEIPSHAFCHPKLDVVNETLVVFENSEVVNKPTSLVWDFSKEQWTSTKDSVLQELRHIRVFSFDETEPLERLQRDRHHYDWMTTQSLLMQ